MLRKKTEYKTVAGAKTAGAPQSNTVESSVLQKAILRLDANLRHFEKKSKTAKDAKDIRARIDAARDEVVKLSEQAEIEKPVFDHLFDMLLKAVPVPNHGIDPALRATYFETLLELKPASIAASRHLARAYSDLGNLAGAKTCLSKLVRQTKDIAFSKRLKKITAYLDRREKLVSSLASNSEFLDAINEVEIFDRWVAESERVDRLRWLVEQAPISLIPHVTSHATQEDQYVFAECIALRHTLVSTRAAKLEEPQLISAFDLRNFVQDKTVCLVGNSSALLEIENGAFIDEHDIVIRFNSFVIEPLHTGEKTTIHCSIHLKDHNRSIKVPIRLILGNAPAAWKQTVKQLSPDAQNKVGDDTLRYPLYASALCDEAMNNAAPTTGYNALRLLHLFSNFAHLHLVGFDGYKSGALRTEEGMREPHAAIHDSEQEMLWIKANTTAVDEHILRLIPLENSEGL